MPFLACWAGQKRGEKSTIEACGGRQEGQLEWLRGDMNSGLVHEAFIVW